MLWSVAEVIAARWLQQGTPLERLLTWCGVLLGVLCCRYEVNRLELMLSMGSFAAALGAMIAGRSHTDTSLLQALANNVLGLPFWCNTGAGLLRLQVCRARETGVVISRQRCMLWMLRQESSMAVAPAIVVRPPVAAVACLCAGIFGMNMRNTLEMSVAGFWGVTIAIVVGCFYVFVAIMRYTQKKRIL